MDPIIDRSGAAAAADDVVDNFRADTTEVPRQNDDRARVLTELLATEVLIPLSANALI